MESETKRYIDKKFNLVVIFKTTFYNNYNTYSIIMMPLHSKKSMTADDKILQSYFFIVCNFEPQVNHYLGEIVYSNLIHWIKRLDNSWTEKDVYKFFRDMDIKYLLHIYK